jgi:hypothetical protein
MTESCHDFNLFFSQVFVEPSKSMRVNDEVLCKLLQDIYDIFESECSSNTNMNLKI